MFFFEADFFALKKGRRRRSKCDRDTGGATMRVGESQCEPGGHDKETALEPEPESESGPRCRPQERSNDQKIEEPKASRRTTLSRDNLRTRRRKTRTRDPGA